MTPYNCQDMARIFYTRIQGIRQTLKFEESEIKWVNVRIKYY